MKQAWKRFAGWARWSWPTSLLPRRETARMRVVASAKLDAAEKEILRLRDDVNLAWMECSRVRVAASVHRAATDREQALRLATQRELDVVLEERNALESGQTASGLSPVQVERLALVAMAAGKLAAEAAKVVLYGWGSQSPTSGRPAYADVEHSMGKLAAMTDVMADAGDVRGGDVRAHAARAKQRLGR